MTTIVYRDDVLVADSKVTFNGVWTGSTIKIGGIGPILFGACGASGTCKRFCDWVVSGLEDDPPPMFSSYGANTEPSWGTIFPGGDVVLSFDPVGPTVLRTPFFADGSGAEIALGALMQGASAEEACRIACIKNNGSGGELMILRRQGKGLIIPRFGHIGD